MLACVIIIRADMNLCIEKGIIIRSDMNLCIEKGILYVRT